MYPVGELGKDTLIVGTYFSTLKEDIFVSVFAPYYKARERSLLRKIEQCRNEGSSTCR